MTHYRTYLYPQCSPNHQGTLQVSRKHTLYWEESGNPNGKPVLFLHGGPGGHTTENHRRFFDPAHYRILMFDQRGAGKSTPKACIEENTPQDLVNDIEALRIMWQVDRWHIFGGSWGSTLALAYAQTHPDRVSGMILRGIFTMRQQEIDWMMKGMETVAPDAYHHFISHLTDNERRDPLESYYQRLTSSDNATAIAAAQVWAEFEESVSNLFPRTRRPDTEFPKEEDDLAIARIEAHYFRNTRFAPDDMILQNIDKIRHIPTIIIHGRYDILCPLATAHALHTRWPEAEYNIIPDAGHAAMEPGITTALVAATEKMKHRNAQQHPHPAAGEWAPPLHTTGSPKQTAPLPLTGTPFLRTTGAHPKRAAIPPRHANQPQSRDEQEDQREQKRERLESPAL